MLDIKTLVLGVEQLAAKLVLCDFTSPVELDQFLKDVAALRSDPQMKELPDVCRIMVSAVAAVGMYKKSDPKKCEAILTCLMGALQQVLSTLDQGGTPAALIQAFNDDIKRITTGAGAAARAAVSEVQTKEIPGFITNTLTALDDVEKGLLLLEKQPDNYDKIDELFRAFHTFKGESNLLGIGHVSALAHEAEDLLGLLREKTLHADEEIANLLLQVVDALRRSLKKLSEQPLGGSVDEFAATINSMKELRRRKIAALAPATPATPPAPVEAAVVPGGEEKFVPQVPVLDLSNGADLFIEYTNEGFDHLTNSEKSVLILESTPGDKEAINNIFRAFHTIKGAAAFLDLRDIRVFAHEAETMLDMVRKGMLTFEGRVVELTLSSVDTLRSLLELLHEQASNGGQLKSTYVDVGQQLAALKEVIASKKQMPVGEILVKQGAVTETELAQALAVQKEFSPDKKIGEILVENNAASSKQVQGALEVQKTGAPVENSIKIQLDKLDSLIDLVGELVISETQVIQSPLVMRIEDQKFHKNLSELDRITRRLQQIAMGMRLVQVGPTFQKMVRLVRDLSKKLGKDISITLSGEETEIDKNMVELVGDPLMHMVRNSVDHGIESRETRVANGKPAGGKVQLSAFHRGGNIVIEIKDDGGGLRKDKILAKAIERGLVKPGEELSDKRIFNLIFEPGFSTAEKVTDVSGRGVGMDVVKKNIEKLRGKVEIDSEPGKGSTFSIYLPITLAIIEGIVVQVGEEKYILPINSVIEFVKADEKSLTLVYGQGEMFSVYGKVYPLLRLGKIFNVPHCREKFEQTTVCIIESDYGRACVLVDELLGQQQVVIKSLGDNLRKVWSCVSGRQMNTEIETYNCIIQPGHLAYSQDPSFIFTVCGNGLVVTMRDKIKGIGGIAHCVYPKAKKGEAPTHYHADVALRSLLKIFMKSGEDASHRLEAQIIGAGNYKGLNRERAEKTTKVVKKILKKKGITVVSEDVGGMLGRKVAFNTATGETMVFKTSKIRRSDWLPELMHKQGFKRVAFERETV